MTMKWPFPRSFLLILPPLLAIPLTAPFAYLLGPASPLQLLDYLIAWLYSLCLITLLFGLALRSDVTNTLIPADLPRFMRPLTCSLLGQTYVAWMLALCAIAILAAFLTTRVGPFATQHAVWVKLALDLDPDAPPPMLLRYGTATADTLAIKWQPYTETNLAIRALGGSPPPIIQKIATDRGEVKLREATIRQGVLTKQGIIADGQRGTLISWPRMAHAIEITLAPGTGTTELLWYDQRVRVQLSQQPTTALLQLPTQLQGWAMLPAHSIGQLALELPPGERTYRFRSVHALSNRPQAWTPAGTRWLVQGCDIDQQMDAIVIHTRADAGCVVSLPDVRPINPIDTPTVIGIWVLIALALLLGLIILTTVLRRIQGYFPLPNPSPTSGEGHTAFVMGHSPAPWRGRGGEGGEGKRVLAPHWIMVVWGIALAWHLVYALTVPIAYANDSLNYYEVGRSLPHMARMADYWSERAPGYPIVIALINGIFGDTALWLIVIQQLALSLLAPLAMWALAGRVAPLIAALTGIAVGISPAMSLAANFIHTEAIYTLCMMAALLIYARLGAYPRVLLLCGLLIGIGAMQRPIGAIALIILVGWLLWLGWSAPAASGAIRRALIGSTALAIGYVALAGPWHIYLALARQTLDPSDGRAAITLWANVVKQRQIDASLPALRPDRAVWELPDTWANDPFELTSQHQQMITSVTDLRQRQYMSETARQATIAFPNRVRESQMVALRYNLALWKLDTTSIYYWEDFDHFFEQWQQIDQTPPPALTSNSLLELMPLLTYRWMPQKSPLRDACLALTQAALDNWGWLSMLALLSPIPLLISNRRLFPCWLYWIALVAASSVIGMPAQRYIVVCESLIYLLAFLSLDAIWSFGFTLWIAANKKRGSSALPNHPAS